MYPTTLSSTAVELHEISRQANDSDKTAESLSEDKDLILLNKEWLFPTETELKVTDTHVRGKYSYSYQCCCCCRTETHQHWDLSLDAINAISTTQPSDAGHLAFITVYACWFFFGIFG